MEIPVFVSSAFREYQRERDALRIRVAPLLNERLRDFNARVAWVDLRWGVDTEELPTSRHKYEHVLEVCFREIARCRPLFLGLLGNHAGWSPPHELVRAMAIESGLKMD